MELCQKCEFAAERVMACEDCGLLLCRQCAPDHQCSGELARAPSEPIDDGKFTMRPYQRDVCRAVWKELLIDGRKSTLVVSPTGTGKTVIFGHLAHQWKQGRVLIVAHRDELIRQAADKVGQIVCEECEIEMGDSRANTGRGIYAPSRVVITSVQTMRRPNRHGCFNPMDFGLVVIDEAHHGTAESYQTVIDHFGQNPNLKILGVTATFDRTAYL